MDKAVRNIGIKYGIDGFTLKWIAIITMVIDHAGVVLFKELSWMRIVGRVSFPIFCFLLVEGFMYTKDINKYGKRLLLFAILSEIPFDLMDSNRLISMRHQNVFFTLFIALVIMIVITNQGNSIIRIGMLVGGVTLAEYLRCDYGAGGILMVLCFYMFREAKLGKAVSIGVVNGFLFKGIQIYGTCSLIPIFLYNGKRGYGMKYFFYLFYPIHLLVLYGIRMFLL